MAKRSRSRQVNRVQRDTFDIASSVRELLDPYAPSVRSPSLEVEDRRTFHPLRSVRPARSSRRPNHLLVAKGMKRVRFAAAPYVMVCVRRKERREVLHAKGVAGSRVSRRRRRNFFSKVGC